MTYGSPQPSDNFRLLVVEDDLDTRDMFDFLLTAQGYHVLSAANGGAALANATFHPVDAIILDLCLPDIDGISLCRLFRHNLGTNVPIILLTADSRQGLKAMAREAGITEFLLKPFHPSDLIECVQQHLGDR